MRWTILKFQLQEAGRPAEFVLRENRCVGMMSNDHVRPVQIHALSTRHFFQRRGELWMDSADIAKVRPPAKETGHPDFHSAVHLIGPSQLLNPNGVGQCISARQKSGEQFSIRREQLLVRVEPQNPVASGLFEGQVLGLGKIVPPRDGMDRSPERPGDCHRPVPGTRISHHDLGSERSDRA